MFRMLTTSKYTKRKIVVRSVFKMDPIVPKIMNFLRINYYPDEPLSKSINLMNSEHDKMLFDHKLKSILNEGASTIAIDPEKEEIVSVQVNKVHDKQQPEVRNKFDEELFSRTKPEHQEFLGKLHEIHTKIMTNADYKNVQKVLELYTGSTCAQWRRDGLLEILVKHSQDVIAKHNNCKLIYTICTSQYTIELFNKLGYKDAFNENMNDLFLPGSKLKLTPPHDKIVCKLLDLR